MGQLTPTVDDIKAMEPWESGRFRTKVSKHEEKVSKPNETTGETSQNNFIWFEIVSEGKFQGRKIKHCFNEKFTVPALNFFKALGATIEVGRALDWEKTINRELDIFVALKTYEGRIQPNITDFYPAS